VVLFYVNFKQDGPQLPLTLSLTAVIMRTMLIGTIIEYIDQQKIICAAVMDIKSKRLRLLTESDREVTLSESRISFKSSSTIDISSGRSSIVNSLKATAVRREKLKESIDLKSLWDLINEENEWVDLPVMAEYCFPAPNDSDQQAAVIRACFASRLYFKFDHNRFLPYTPGQVEKALELVEAAARKETLMENGALWLQKAVTENNPERPDGMPEVLDIIKSYFLLEKESPHYKTGKELFAKAGISPGASTFNLLVKLGEFKDNENLDFHRLQVPVHFSSDALQRTEDIRKADQAVTAYQGKEDYTHISAITIDGKSTSDYDDALSIEKIGDSYVLGIHISDVSWYIEKGDILDRKALARGASIYTPDMKVPMLPAGLSEDICSLVGGELRPSLSVIVTLNRFFEIKDYEVVSTQIRIDRQLTYSMAENLAKTDSDIATLVKIGTAFREKRLQQGALQITLPEVNPYLEEDGTVGLATVDRESPPRMMVAEMMIMANWLTAGFIARHNLPAVFRSQPEPKERLYRGESDSLFQNALQRKFVSRAIISHKSAFHSGLGVDAYTTATSPIRRYYDLISQRQVKAALGLYEPYTVNEITRLIQILDAPMSNVGLIQFKRKRYWMLKYLESRNGTRTPAIVLNKRRNSYTILLTEYMLEYFLPTSGLNLKPQDMISVVIQHANPRKDSFSVYPG